ncbi:MAG: TonB-dependent copper receptor [Thermoanaerobaculia bacterium]
MMSTRNARILCSAALLLALVFNPLVFAQEESVSPVSESQDEEKDVPVVSEEIQVFGEWSVVPAVRILGRDELPEVPIGDGADLLRGVAGVTVGRMGGHGLEPRIRGLGGGNLNVLVDGAYVHGGCPNRMDPPSSFAAPNSFDEVTVIKGVQSMRFGPGGSAGTVVFERNVPIYADPPGWEAEIASSYGSWHKRPELGIDASLVSGGFFLRAQGGVRSFDSYDDGNGETVRSGFESEHANLMLGFGKTEKGRVELGLEAIRTDDALFAGAGMDSPEDAADTYRLELRRGDQLLGLVDLRADLYYTAVEHLMDNYSLRPLTAPMAMRVPSTSDTYGGRVSGDREISQSLTLTIGFDYQENRRDALRYASLNPEQVDMLQSVMWPDATLGQGGLMMEGTQLLGNRSRLLLGGRIDRFTAKAEKADVKPAGVNRSPNELYDYYYGARATDWSDSELSGLLRFERFLTPRLTFFSGLSRSARAADTTERYLGSNNPEGAKRWVGNPQLDVAKHTQLDLGFSAPGTSSNWSVTGFVDQVDDFILRDRAHGQQGILQEDNATIYRNVEARLIGLELEGSYRPGKKLQLDGVVSWVRGQNRTDDRPLAQIPPLQGRVQLDYGLERWQAAGIFHWAASQTRVDDDPMTGSGQDYGETPGYGLVDLSGGYEIITSLSISAGVDNLFDRAYANHLNRGNLFDPDPVRINEPGRTFWVRLSWRGGAS